MNNKKNRIRKETWSCFGFDFGLIVSDKDKMRSEVMVNVEIEEELVDEFDELLEDCFLGKDGKFLFWWWLRFWFSLL